MRARLLRSTCFVFPRSRSKTNAGQRSSLEALFAAFFSCAALDCEGGFVVQSGCTQSCGGGSQVSVFVITRAAVGTGVPCVSTNGSTMSEACNTQACRMFVRVDDLCISAWSTIPKIHSTTALSQPWYSVDQNFLRPMCM